MQAAEWEIEEHVSETNNFFKQTGFTLDDLHEYAKPVGSVVRALYRASEGYCGPQEAVALLLQAVEDLKAIHIGMDLENAAL